MTFLVLDSATERSACALFVENRVIAEKHLQIGLTHTRLLMPAVVALCEEAKVGVQDLDFIAAGVGPGSFTGIRVSCSIGKGMAAGLGVPLVGVSSLKGFIPYKEYTGRFVGAIDARMGGIFCIEGYSQDGVITFVSEETLMSLTDFEALMCAVGVIITPDAAPLKKRIATLASSESVAIIERSPDIEFMGRLASDMFQQGAFSDLEPLYLRATQAEIEREQKKNT